MAITIERRYSQSIHPFHAVLLAGSIPLFLGAVLSDAAYARTYEIQWQNFASWLIVGALIFAGFALLFAIADLVRADRRVRGLVLYSAVLFIAWLVGLFNAFMHARDAWAGMPTGLVLSVIAALLVCVAAWLGFHARRGGGAI